MMSTLVPATAPARQPPLRFYERRNTRVIFRVSAKPVSVCVLPRDTPRRRPSARNPPKNNAESPACPEIAARAFASDLEAARLAGVLRSGYDGRMRYLVDQPARPGEAEIAARPGEQEPLVVTLGEQRFQVEVLARGPRWLLCVGGRPMEVVLDGPLCDVAGHSLRVIPEQARAVVASRAQQTRVISPIAGRIVRLHHGEGEEVAAGKPLLVVEAMKMENELVAPCDGHVSFYVEEGQTVETGAVLAEVTPAQS